MTRKLTLADAQAAAIAKGGKCLSTTYVDAGTKMEWECGDCGYIWPAIFRSIRNLNSWCPECAGNARLTIEHAKRIAVKKGGKCLSTEYKNNHEALLWECGKCSYQWPASMNKVKDADHWCPECAGNLSLTIDDAKQIAESRGGLCLSTVYVNDYTHLNWQCGKCGNTWPASLASVKRLNTWCPYCSKKNECATRELFEELTGHKFPLKSGLFDVNRRWQLDGYCPELGVAFEYNGPQHYEIHPHFHRNGIDDLKKQQERDVYVARASLELKPPVYIIEVPYWLSDKERQIYVWRELWFLKVLDAGFDNETGIPPF